METMTEPAPGRRRIYFDRDTPQGRESTLLLDLEPGEAATDEQIAQAAEQSGLTVAQIRAAL